MTVEISDLDQMQSAYKTAVDHWITTIREEEALASTDHSEQRSMPGRQPAFAKKTLVKGQAGKEGIRRRSSREVLQLLASAS